MVRNAIYTQVASYIESKVTGVYCTSEYELIPKSMPCAFIIQAEKVRPIDSVTFSDNDNVEELTIEVQVFTNTGYEDAWTIMGHAEDKLKAIGFIEDYCSPQENIEAQYQRLVARFHSKVCGGIL